MRIVCLRTAYHFYRIFYCFLFQKFPFCPPNKMKVLVTQSYLTLCDPMDCNPPGSSVHGILQARILEWVAMPSSGGVFPTQGSNPCLLHPLHWRAGSLPLVPPGKPQKVVVLMIISDFLQTCAWHLDLSETLMSRECLFVVFFAIFFLFLFIF